MHAGYAGMTQAECEGKGCCWAPADFEGAPHVDLPWCFKANAGDSKYQATQLDWGEGEGQVRGGLASGGEAEGLAALALVWIDVE